MLRIFLATLLLLTFCLDVNATKLSGQGVEKVFMRLTYDYNSRPDEKVFDNIMRVTTPTYGITIDRQFKTPNDSEDIFWFRKLMSDTAYVLAVDKVTLDIENLTEEPFAIKWGQSNLRIGNFSGVPFLAGMKYKDAGNPAATPDTLIPPKDKQRVNLYLGNPYFKDKWHDGVAFIKASGNLNAMITMKVDTNAGSKYYSFQTPNMVLPSSVVEAYTKK